MIDVGGKFSCFTTEFLFTDIKNLAVGETKKYKDIQTKKFPVVFVYFAAQQQCKMQKKKHGKLLAQDMTQKMRSNNSIMVPNH